MHVLTQVNQPPNTGTLGRGVILRDYNCPMNPEKGNVSMVLFEGACRAPPNQSINQSMGRARLLLRRHPALVVSDAH